MEFAKAHVNVDDDTLQRGGPIDAGGNRFKWASHG